MGMEGLTECATPGCSEPIFGSNNLCEKHKLWGKEVRNGRSTMIITAWRARHGRESGIIFINDWKLATSFDGTAGFEQKLCAQGFTGVRYISTPQAYERAQHQAEREKIADWSGVWLPRYPWEPGNENLSGSDFLRLFLKEVKVRFGPYQISHTEGNFYLRFENGQTVVLINESLCAEFQRSSNQINEIFERYLSEISAFLSSHFERTAVS